MRPLGTGDPLRLGPYRLLGILGEGGMGKVYIGQDAAGTVAAVKVLRPEMAHDQGLAQRFVREAHMAQAVTSRGVARVLGAQTDGGRPWIATEFLAGPTLDQAVGAHGSFDEATVRVLASALVRTLADIHAAGMVHRDIKPSNIVLTSTGPRIIDFGIARPEHGLTLTTTGQAPVTPGYGAPEQVLGQRVGPPADVFSLGAVLVYANTGEQAFAGTHVPAVQYEVVHGAPRLEHVPQQLASLVAPCLAKDPAQRPTPAQMSAVFTETRGADRIWRHGPLAADITQRERTVHRMTTVPSGAGASRNISRRRLVSVLAVGSTVVAAGGGAAAWWLKGRTEEDPFSLPPAAGTPEADRVTASTRPPKPLWGPVPALGKGSAQVLPVRDVLLVAGPDGSVAAYSVTDGEQRWSAAGIDTKAGFLSLSDALVAAVDTKGRLVTFVASSGERRWTAPAQARKLLATDESAVYVSTKDGRLRSINRADGTVRWTVRTEADLLTERRPTGAAAKGRLVVATRPGMVVTVDTANGRPVWDIADQASADLSLIQPTVLGDTVFLNGASLTARNLADGMELWGKSEMVDDKLQPSGPPLVHEDTVYTSQGPYVLGYRASDGTEVWRSPESYFLHSPVAVQGDTVCAINSRPTGAEGAEARAMSRSTGKHAWTRSLAANAGSYGVNGAGNRLFVVAGEQLTALPVFG
jgi:serine/threonine protein kinase/outer membrane protein assembly factor BamB